MQTLTQPRHLRPRLEAMTRPQRAKVPPRTSSQIPHAIDAGFSAPGWTWRSILVGSVVTVGLYLGLPALSKLAQPPRPQTTIRPASTIHLPPPPIEPEVQPESMTTPTASRLVTPKPQLLQECCCLAPLEIPMDLSITLDDVSGDFALNFNVAQPGDLSGQVQQLIFDLGDLDQHPQALTRLRPIYPAQARHRGIEGEVLLEFIVAADGSIRNITVVASTPGDTFVSAARRAVQRWRFTPGTRHGESVNTRVRQKLTFTLD